MRKREITIYNNYKNAPNLRKFFVLSIVAMIAASSANASIQKEDIFQEAPFASCHASTIVQLRNGDFMAAWFGGTAEGKPDVAIWGARRSEGRWSAPVELVREKEIATWNPVLFYMPDGKLWLYYKFGANPGTWTAGRKYSDDDGKTWSPPEHLPAGLYGPIRAKPLVQEDGTVISGTSVESYSSWAAWIERSTDGGKSWTKAGPIVPVLPQAIREEEQASDKNRTGIIQPSVISLGGKHLRFYARSTLNIAKICVSDSFDDGITWTLARPIDVPNPNSGIDAVRLRDGRIVLVYNHTTTGRTPLNLAVSTDGEHFRMFATLEDQPGEYSYPAMIQGQDSALYITYTWKRKTIRFVQVPLAEIPQ